MDNRKSMIPRILEKSKSLSLDYRLPSKITGCITTSSLYPENRKVKFFINHGKNHIYPKILPGQVSPNLKFCHNYFKTRTIYYNVKTRLVDLVGLC